MFDAGDHFMIQQIQSEEDDTVDDENVDENSSDVDDSVDAEDQSAVDQPTAGVGPTFEWRVVPIKPGGVKALDCSQYVDDKFNFYFNSF